ncbi:MAG: hypothetical protein BAA01_11535 [Bacillus thermozeamaize]|uniref:DUF4274 domain-containing protein n=1 Tax=Bacillus thermozeamaize TaxID=230954 RepID=A0A1Y3PHP1_9BACI|nr:MAG: hypothetical protein BAA01_11535 [Bacillus thermozeamaize]
MIYFANDDHKRNFGRLIERFPEAYSNGEYLSACYLAAYPGIYKCFTLVEQEHGPFDWFIRSLDETAADETAALTGQTWRLAELAVNLWNGRPVNLADGIDVWDEVIFQTALQAICLRRSPSLVFTAADEAVCSDEKSCSA